MVVVGGTGFAAVGHSQKKGLSVSRMGPEMARQRKKEPLIGRTLARNLKFQILLVMFFFFFGLVLLSCVPCVINSIKDQDKPLYLL